MGAPSPNTAEAAAVIWLRVAACLLALTAGAAAGLMFLQYAAAVRLSHLAFVAAGLLTLSTAWLAWGAIQGMIGLSPRLPAMPEVARITARTVVLVPICEEDAATTFARVAAMRRQLAARPEVVDFAILSDTRSAAGAAAEEAALARLLADCAGPGGKIHYRRRTQNHGRKAGNIAEFIMRSGAAWDFALILDADSLMESETILTMIRRMEAAPDLGLLQSLPRVVRAASVFGRAMQFSSAFHGPVFTRGLARLQGRTGPYWGHNALVRINAFAQCCGLPDLAGRPPFGGHILSHDYVEATLLARGGWVVRTDSDLGGSYEEGPENIVAHAKRDRRWCQGNMQHARLLRTRGLRFWSRAMLMQGILAYLSSAFWALFLLTAALAAYWQAAPNYFPDTMAVYPDRPGFLPVFPSDESARALGLLIGIFGLLLLPKLLVGVEALLTGRARGFGGPVAWLSLLAELALSAVIAPVLMAFQCRALFQIFAGRDGGWPPNARGDGRMTLAEGWAAARFITFWGLGALVAAWWLAPDQLPWLMPVFAPMALAPAIIALTSRDVAGAAAFTTPEERALPPILALHDRILSGWTGQPAPEPATIAQHAPALAS